MQDIRAWLQGEHTLFAQLPQDSRVEKLRHILRLEAQLCLKALPTGPFLVWRSSIMTAAEKLQADGGQGSKLTKLQLYALVLKLVEASLESVPQFAVQTNLYRLHPDSMTLGAFAFSATMSVVGFCSAFMGSIKTTTRS